MQLTSLVCVVLARFMIEPLLKFNTSTSPSCACGDKQTPKVLAMLVCVSGINEVGAVSKRRSDNTDLTAYDSLTLPVVKTEAVDVRTDDTKVCFDATASLIEHLSAIKINTNTKKRGKTIHN